MSVKLISVTPDAEKTMAYCARVSSPDQSKQEVAGLFRYCMTQGHWSIWEMGNAVFEIETSRAISAQILRHRSFSFQEFSQRYAAVDETGLVLYVARRQDKKNRQNSIDDLSDTVKIQWQLRQEENWRQCFDNYQWALDNGIAKECARMVLPLGCSTKIYMSGSPRSWIHYLQLRTGNGTQLEHMDIANDIKHIFVEQFPHTSEALGWTPKIEIS
jgi:thymidylate synthase (FAD)